MPAIQQLNPNPVTTFITGPSWHNLVVRPSAGGEQVTLQLQGVVALPNLINTTGGPVPNGLRAIAHVGFVGGTPNNGDQLSVQSAVEVDFGSSFNPNVLSSDCFQMTTQQWLTMNRSNGGVPTPLLLLDMPIRFDKMNADSANGTTTAQTDNYFDAGVYAVNLWNSARWNGGVDTAGNNVVPQTAFVTITLMITLNSTDPSTAVGLYGIRLVPDYTR